MATRAYSKNLGPSFIYSWFMKLHTYYFYFSAHENMKKLPSKVAYSVIHNSIAPSKELCSKMALGEVGVSLP